MQIIHKGTALEVLNYVAERERSYLLTELRVRAQLLDTALRAAIYQDVLKRYFVSAKHRAEMLQAMEDVLKDSSISIELAISYIEQARQSLE
jgi:phage-related baseplate assembly protein